MTLDTTNGVEKERLLLMFTRRLLFHESELPLEDVVSVGLILPLRSRLTGAGSRVGNPVAEVVVVQVEDTRRKSPDGRLLRNLFGIVIFSPFSEPSSESEHVEFSLKVTRGFTLGL